MEAFLLRELAFWARGADREKVVELRAERDLALVLAWECPRLRALQWRRMGVEQARSAKLCNWWRELVGPTYLSAERWRAPSADLVSATTSM